MGKFKYTLSNIWFWIVIAIGCFIMESVYFFTIPGVSFAHESFWILAIAGIGSSIVYFYLEHKKNKLKFDKVALPVFILIFILLTISLWTQDGEVIEWANGQGANDLSMSVAEKIRYTFMLGFSIMTAYMILFTHNHNAFSSKKLVWLPIAFVIFALFNIVYSLIAEFDDYRAMFDTGTSNLSNIVSIYNNPNFFGAIILIALCACAVINYAKPNIPTFIAMIIFFVWTLIIGSGTCVICALIFVPVYLVIEIIRGIKERPIKTAIWTSLFIAFIVAVIITFAVCVDKEVEFFVNFERHLDLLRNDTAGHMDNLTSRVDKWIKYINYGSDNPWHLLFGRGFNYNHKVITAVIGATQNKTDIGSITPENGFVDLFLHGGLLALGAYLFICVYFVYCCIYLFIKKRKAFSALYLLIFIIMTMNNFLENNLFFDLGGKESFITIAYYAPVVAAYRHLKYKNGVKKQEVKAMDIENKPLSVSTITQTLSVIFVTLITVCLSLIPAAIYYETGAALVIIFNVLYASISLLLFIPYLVSMWAKGASPKGFIIQLISNLVFIVLGTIAVGAIFYLVDGLSGFAVLAMQIALHVILLGYTLVYSLLRKGCFKEYLINNFVKPFSMCRYAGPATLTVLIPLSIILSNFYTFSVNTYCTLAILATSIFLAVLFLVPNKPKNELEQILNDKDRGITISILKRGELNGKTRNNWY